MGGIRCQISSLEYLAWWEHAQIEDSDGNKGPPNRLELCARYGLNMSEDESDGDGVKFC